MTIRQRLLEDAAREVRMWNRENGRSASSPVTLSEIQASELWQDSQYHLLGRFDIKRFIADVNKANRTWI